MSIYEQHFLGDYAKIWIEHVGAHEPPTCIVIGVLGWANAYDVEQARKLAAKIDIQDVAHERAYFKDLANQIKQNPDVRPKVNRPLRRVVITYLDRQSEVLLNNHNAPLAGNAKSVKPPDYGHWPFKELQKKKVGDPTPEEIQYSAKVFPDYGWKLNDQKEISRIRREAQAEYDLANPKKKDKKEKRIESQLKAEAALAHSPAIAFEKKAREAARLYAREHDHRYQMKKAKREKKHAYYQKVKAERLEAKLGKEKLSVVVYQYQGPKLPLGLPYLVQAGSEEKVPSPKPQKSASR